MKKQWILIFFAALGLFLTTGARAQNGPGGVGDTTATDNLVLWLKADAITGVDSGTVIQTWVDKSGYNRNATQTINTNYRPTYLANTLNGQPVVFFDGSDDYLVLSSNIDVSTAAILMVANKRTVGSGYRTMLATQKHLILSRSLLSDQWGAYYERPLLPGPALDSSYKILTHLERNYNDVDFVTNGGTLVTKTDGTGFSGKSVGTVGSNNDNSSTSTLQHHPGNFAEIIYYNTVLNTAQRLIVENYLSAKYAISIDSSNDKYTFTTTYINDVAGIGQASDASKHDTSSASILTISTPSALDNDEFMLFGHDNGSISSWTSTDVPTGLQRITRKWRVDVTGTPGTVTVTLDTTGLAARPNSSDRFFLMVDADGTFNSGATVYPLTQIGSTSRFKTDNVSIPDSSFLTFAAGNNPLSFTTTSNTANEVDAETLSVVASLASVTNANVTFTIDTSGTAVGSGNDYTLLGSTSRTITAGGTTDTIKVAVVDDAIEESPTTDTLRVALRNVSSNVTIGADSVHHIFIVDDDAAIKATFITGQTTSAESVSPARFILKLVSRFTGADTTAPSPVSGSVTVSGTATGSGTDYTMASTSFDFPVGVSRDTLEASINEDALDEDDETIIVSIATIDNAALGDTTTQTHTIQDNDDPPSVRFAAAADSASEGAGSATVQLELSTASGRDVIVKYTTSGSATKDTDYTIPDSLTISEGDTSANLTITITDDQVNEQDETVVVTLSGTTTNATLDPADTVYTLTILDDDAFGFTGPGGVGQSTNTVLWLKADAITGVDSGAVLQTWSDSSGNNNDATQTINTAYRPTYLANTLNGQPVVFFDGSDDYLVLDSNIEVSTATILMVANKREVSSGLRAMLTAQKHLLVSRSSTSDQWGAHYTQTLLSGSTLGPGYSILTHLERNYNDVDFVTNGGTVVNKTNGTAFSGKSVGTIGSNNDNSSSSATQHHPGNIAEIIFYNTVLNRARRTIVENYLSAKYGLTIGNDFYAGDNPAKGDYDLDVEGIGTTDGTDNNRHIQAQNSRGLILIENNSSLDNTNEFVLAGHKSDTNFVASTNLPSGVVRRWERIWYIDKTGSVDVKLGFDFSDAGFPGHSLTSADNYRLLFRSDTTGTFRTIGLNPSTNTIANTDQVLFTVANDSLQDGYYTIGTTNLDTPLPVELVLFAVTQFPKQTAVQLAWRTEAEVDNAKWLVERREEQGGTPGEEGGFETIAELEGQGNNSSATDYLFVDKQVESGHTYTYRLADVSFAGQVTYHQEKTITVAAVELPQAFDLSPNYPNPFNPATRISYALPVNAEVWIEVYNVLGQKVKTLVHASQEAGFYETGWDGKNDNGLPVASGIFIYRMRARGKQGTYFVKIQKMLLIK